MELKEYEYEKELREDIMNCEDSDHVQQIAFSSYHNSLTQVCFTCKKVRTNLINKELSEDG